MIYLDAAATTLEKPPQVRQAMAQAAAELSTPGRQPSRRPPGGGDGLPVSGRGGGAIRRAVAGERGVHHERYPRVEHRHPVAGGSRQPGGDLRL